MRMTRLQVVESGGTLSRALSSIRPCSEETVCLAVHSSSSTLGDSSHEEDVRVRRVRRAQRHAAAKARGGGASPCHISATSHPCLFLASSSPRPSRLNLGGISPVLLEHRGHPLDGVAPSSQAESALKPAAAAGERPSRLGRACARR